MEWSVLIMAQVLQQLATRRVASGSSLRWSLCLLRRTGRGQDWQKGTYHGFDTTWRTLKDNPTAYLQVPEGERGKPNPMSTSSADPGVLRPALKGRVDAKISMLKAATLDSLSVPTKAANNLTTFVSCPFWSPEMF